MVQQKVKVTNVNGIHARPAGVLAKAVRQCSSEIVLVANGKELNPRSVLQVMSGGIRCDTEVEVRCTGETEAEDLKAIVDIIASGLGE